MTDQMCSPFLSLLPRELRDEIYSHVLVQPTEILIDSGITSRQNFREIPLSQQRGHDGTGDYPPLEVVYPLAVPVRNRSTWKVGLKQLAPWHRLSYSFSDDGRSIGPVDAAEVMVELSYQVAHTPHGSSPAEEAVGVYTAVSGLQCLLVCQQMYEEAREVFYSKNTFTAVHHAAFVHFLQDRRKACRYYIRSLKMHFDKHAWETSLGPGATWYCDDFHELCRVLNGPLMNVRSLEVSVFNGSLEPSWTGKVTIASCMRKRDHRPSFLEEFAEKKR